MKTAIIETLQKTINLYKSSFKLFFVFSLSLSILIESLKIYALKIELYDTLGKYFEYGNILDYLESNALLMFLGVFSIFTTIGIYGLLIYLCKMQFENKSPHLTISQIYKALYIFKGRFWCFFLVFFINVFLSGLSGFLGIIGVWLINSFSFIVFPIILLANIGISQAYYRSFIMMSKNVTYALQIGFIEFFLLGIKHVTYFTFSNIYCGLEHTIIILTDALLLPFVTMLMIVVYHHLLTLSEDN